MGFVSPELNRQPAKEWEGYLAANLIHDTISAAHTRGENMKHLTLVLVALVAVLTITTACALLDGGEAQNSAPDDPGVIAPDPYEPEPAPPATGCNCTGPDLNCADFSTHAEAQACYERCKDLGYGDVFRLDGDNDGSACESLP